MTKTLISKQQYHQFLKNQKNADKIQSQINRFFEPEWMLEDSDVLGSKNVLEPRIEISETDKAVNIIAEIPGLCAKDIDIAISADGYLTISGEKKSSHENKGKGFYFSECSYGTVQRTILLPNDVDVDKSSAECDKGVLMISIPKLAVAQKKIKRIAVKGK